MSVAVRGQLLNRNLRLAGALFVSALVVKTWQAQVQAQTIVEPVNSWGGHAIHAPVPYQPSVVFVTPDAGTDAIFLDQLVPPCDAPIVISDVYSNFAETPALIRQSAEPQLPPGTRDGVFQKLFFTGTWLPQFEGDSLGWGDLETGVVLGFPFLRRDTPLLVTPRFGVHFLDRPAVPDLPDRVHDAAVEFRHLRRFGDGPWAMDAAVTLGYYSDFEVDDADAFRVTGRALGVYESASGAKWIFGVAYLNRADVSVIPVGGVIYAPTPDVKLELIVPRPRIAWQLPGRHNDGDNRWVYVGGEFGGGVWSITRPATQTRDLLTYNDYRVLVGYEREIVGGLSCRYEVGYVFGRELQFASATPDTSLDDTLFVQAGLTY